MRSLYSMLYPLVGIWSMDVEKNSTFFISYQYNQHLDYRKYFLLPANLIFEIQLATSCWLYWHHQRLDQIQQVLEAHQKIILAMYPPDFPPEVLPSPRVLLLNRFRSFRKSSTDISIQTLSVISSEN